MTKLHRFTKLAADGSELPADATDHAAVRDETLYLIGGKWQTLIWQAHGSIKEFNWKAAQKEAAKVDLLGASDWRLPEADELQTLVDRSKFDPAIDQNFFPDTKSDWYWTATRLAASPADYAWDVLFDGGLVNDNDQVNKAFVRAVRSVPSGQ